MAQLRDRYASHGFDDEGNDKNLTKLLDKHTKALIEYCDATKKYYNIQKEYNQLTKKELEEKKKQNSLRNPENLGKLLANLPSNVGSAIGSGAKAIGRGALGATEKALPVMDSLLAATGPAGYMLGQGLKIGRGVAGILSNFGKWGKKKSSTDTSESGTDLIRSNKGGTPIHKSSFEALPTMVKLRSWLNFQTKDNPLFRKYMLKMQDSAKQTEKYQKENDKLAKAQKKVLESMKKDTEISALQSKLIFGGVLLGVAALIAAGVAIKRIYDHLPGWLKKEDTSNTNANPLATGEQTAKSFGGFQSGKYGETLIQTSGYGYRKSTGSFHHGIDIGTSLKEGGSAIEGAPVRSMTPGIAHPMMEVKGKGFQKFYRAKKGETPVELKGYGNFVRVEIPQAVLNKWGYPNVKAGPNSYVQYSHLLDILVEDGAKVSRGTILGKIGHTGGQGSNGAAIATHLDVSVWINGSSVDPNKLDWTTSEGATTKSFIDAYKTWATKPIQQKETTKGGQKIQSDFASYTSQEDTKPSPSPTGVKLSSSSPISMLNLPEGWTATSKGVYDDNNNLRFQIDKDGNLVPTNLTTTGKNDNIMGLNNNTINQGSVINNTSGQPSQTTIINNNGGQANENTTVLSFGNSPSSELNNSAKANTSYNYNNRR